MGLLAFFKYYTFTAENLNRLLQLFGADLLPVLQITLPISISFYTFESMSYTIEVYRGVVKPARSFSDLSCFISLFPHLIAGPIVRYNVIAEQLASREHSWDKFSTGVALFIVGFAKKILLANPMGSAADAVFATQSPYFMDAWFGGNRQNQRRTYFNLALVMLLGGLWHGASWTFVIWGAYHGTLLASERWRGKKSLYAWLRYSGRVAVTFVLVLFSWVLFRSSSFPHALSYLRSMFGVASGGTAAFLLAAEIYTPYSLAILGLCALLSFQRLEINDWVEGLNWSRSMILVPLFVLAVMVMFTQTFNPFLYFQF